MKLIWALLLVSLTVSHAPAKERLPFPFDQSTRVTFIRLGNLELDAGQQFALSFRDGQWTIERRISRYSATYQDITPDEAYEILAAFSGVYKRWQNSPYRDVTKNGYSLYISIDQTWQTTIRVRDRGSPELRHLIEIIEYPVGLVLNEVKTNSPPGAVNASTVGTNSSSSAAP